MDSFLINSSLLLLSAMFCILSSEWLILFILMEINSFTFCFFLTPKINSMVKYFLIQGVGSISILLSMIFSLMMFSPSIYFILSWGGVMLKLAAMPFFIWITFLCTGISWMELILILSWQKIIPLWVSFLINSSLLLLSAMFCILVGGIILVNNSSTRLLLVLSSISYSGWLLFSSILSSFIFFITFLIYLFILYTFSISLFENLELWFSFLASWKKKVLVILFSMGGIPPLIGFLPKWIILLSFTVLNIFASVILMSLTLINLFCYMKMFSSLMISKTVKESTFSMLLFFNLTPMILIILFLGTFLVGS